VGTWMFDRYSSACTFGSVTARIGVVVFSFWGRQVPQIEGEISNVLEHREASDDFGWFFHSWAKEEIDTTQQWMSYWHVKRDT